MLVRLLGGGGRGGGLRFKVCSSSVVSTVEMSEDDNVESSEEDSFEMEGSGWRAFRRVRGTGTGDSLLWVEVDSVDEAIFKLFLGTGVGELSPLLVEDESVDMTSLEFFLGTGLGEFSLLWVVDDSDDAAVFELFLGTGVGEFFSSLVLGTGFGDCLVSVSVLAELDVSSTLAKTLNSSFNKLVLGGFGGGVADTGADITGFAWTGTAYSLSFSCGTAWEGSLLEESENFSTTGTGVTWPGTEYISLSSAPWLSVTAHAFTMIDLGTAYSSCIVTLRARDEIGSGTLYSDSSVPKLSTGMTLAGTL